MRPRWAGVVAFVNGLAYYAELGRIARECGAMVLCNEEVTIPRRKERKKRGKPSVVDIINALSYDPETGILRWNESKRGRKTGKGGLAGCWGEGRLFITINGVQCQGHLLAWVIFYGEWPSRLIDHRDMNTSNNRIDNLRLATGSENNANCRKRAHNTSGMKGVGWDKQKSKWYSKISFQRKHYWLGYFDTKDEAHAAYVSAAKKIHGEFARAS